ncbi:MAG: hypothetical protein ACKVZJ_05965 [Phycisphaerales bacterium]
MTAIVLVCMFPAFVVGSFRGTTLLAHAHHGHGTHLHAASSQAAARQLAAEHVAAHEAAHAHHEHDHDHPSDHDRRPCGIPLSGDSDTPMNNPADDDHDGVLVTVPDHEQMNQRSGAELPRDHSVVVAVWAAWSHAWIATAETSSSTRAGPFEGPPRHLCALTVRRRLVATSGALLI